MTASINPLVILILLAVGCWIGWYAALWLVSRD